MYISAFFFSFRLLEYQFINSSWPGKENEKVCCNYIPFFILYILCLYDGSVQEVALAETTTKAGTDLIQFS